MSVNLWLFSSSQNTFDDLKGPKVKYIDEYRDTFYDRYLYDLKVGAVFVVHECNFPLCLFFILLIRLGDSEVLLIQDMRYSRLSIGHLS